MLNTSFDERLTYYIEMVDITAELLRLGHRDLALTVLLRVQGEIHHQVEDLWGGPVGPSWEPGEDTGVSD